MLWFAAALSRRHRRAMCRAFEAPNCFCGLASAPLIKYLTSKSSADKDKLCWKQLMQISHYYPQYHASEISLPYFSLNLHPTNFCLTRPAAADKRRSSTSTINSSNIPSTKSTPHLPRRVSLSLFNSNNPHFFLSSSRLVAHSFDNLSQLLCIY
jgi:hypothetical protein